MKDQQYVDKLNLHVLRREMGELTAEQESRELEELDDLWFSLTSEEQDKVDQRNEAAPGNQGIPPMVDQETALGTSTPCRREINGTANQGK